MKNPLAFPHHWQRPAKTEEWVYEHCVDGLRPSTFSQLVCFPWATLIDLLRKTQGNKAELFQKKLSQYSPRSTLIRATVCQHIYALDMLEWFNQLGITDLYWSHAVKNQTEIEGIRIHPFPLYPVRCMDEDFTKIYKKPLSERKYLYNFVGAYDAQLYLTPVRQWILELPDRPDAIATSRSEWHYEKDVYQNQIEGMVVPAEDHQILQNRGIEYSEVMAESIFSLCPSGSGPNSIRFWESLGFGCIPVLLSDTLRLPGDQALWDRAIVRVAETEEAVAEMPARLEALRNQPEKLLEMQEACRQLWELYGLNGPVTVLSELADRKVIRERVLG